MEKEKLLKFREAMKIEDMETIEKMIDVAPELVEVVSPFGTLLHDSARQGKYNVTKYLLEKGSDANANGGKYVPITPIVSATLSGQLCLVELLYSYGTFLDTSNSKNNILFWSIAEGYDDIAKFSIDKDIDITAKYDIGEKENWLMEQEIHLKQERITRISKPTSGRALAV